MSIIKVRQNVRYPRRGGEGGRKGPLRQKVRYRGQNGYDDQSREPDGGVGEVAAAVCDGRAGAHGKKHLSSLLATLNLLAFLFHTLLGSCDEHYRLVRAALPSRQTFFQHVSALTHYL